MDLRKIKKLIELVEESGIAELEVKSGDEAVRIARPVVGMGAGMGVGMGVGMGAGVGMAPIGPISVETPVAASAVTSGAAPSSASKPQPAAPSLEIRAPMAGTFYAASEPGAPAFCSAGSQVAVGDVVCIIESMKMMNEIRTEHSGAVVELLVANAEPVSSGQVLMRLS